MERPSEKSVVKSSNQYLITAIVNIMAFSVGTSVGWASPSLPLLQAETSPIGRTLTSSEISWVGSIFSVGALFGTLSFGWLSEKIGRFNAILLTTVPELLWWIIVALQLRLEILIVGRLLSGLAAGAIFVLVPLYTTEIADEKSRGVLGSFFIFSINLGTLLMFVTGAYTSYRVNALIMMVLPIVFLVTFYLVNPETPQYLFKKGKVQEAEKCLKFLRGVSKAQQTPESVKNELLMISQRIEENAERGNVSILEELSHRSSRRGLLIGATLAVVQQLCGCFVFINYTADIFKQAGSSLSPNDSAIIVAVIQIFGSTVSPFAIGRFPRKVVYSMTCVGVILGLVTFGTHGLVGSMIDRGTISLDFDYSSLGWIPIATLSFVIFVASVGILPMTFILISEILPIKIRSFGISVCTGLLWGLSALLLRFFDDIVALISLPVCLFIFAGCTFFGMIFVLVIVPETRNRTNDQIEKLLN